MKRKGGTSWTKVGANGMMLVASEGGREDEDECLWSSGRLNHYLGGIIQAGQRRYRVKEETPYVRKGICRGEGERL